MGRVEVQIKIPFKTPSVNHLYGHRGHIMFLTTEARRLRQEIIQLCDKSEAMRLQGTKLSVTAEIYENWWYKTGGVKRVDIANREKFMIDSVFLGLELDDKWIFELKLIKIQSENEEKTIIKIKEID